MIQRAVVTGGAGVIGRVLVRLLADQGTSILSLDRRDLDFRHPLVSHFRTELTDMAPAILRHFDPTHIFHLAASFERSDEESAFWEENQRDNVSASAAVLRGALACSHIERYVFASSYLVYDPELYCTVTSDSAVRLLQERDRLDPRNACGAAKLLHEREIELAGRDRFTSTSARIFRVYGRGSRDVISRWIRSALDRRPIDTFDLSGRFDYVFADDVADGLLRLGASELTGAVNLATGRPHRVGEALGIISRELGPPQQRHVAATGGLVEASGADTTLLEKELHWLPRFDLDEGIRAVIEYERAQRESPSPDFRTRPRRALRILLPSGGAKVSLVKGFQRALRSMPVDGYVLVADVDPTCPAGLVADRLVSGPRIEDMSDDELISWVVGTGANIVVPSRDAELRRWSTLMARLKDQGIYVAVAPGVALDVCLDKLAFAKWAGDHGLPVIPTSTSIDDIEGDRLVVKQRWGAGGRNAYVDVDRDSAAVLGSMIADPIYQPWIAGMELSADFYVDGRTRRHGPVVRERRRVRGGESVDTKVVASHGIFEALVDRLGSEIGFRGAGCAQAIRRADDSLLLLEVNARFGGASAAAVAAGLPLSELVIREALGEPVPAPGSVRLIRLVRLPGDLVLPE